MKLSNLICCIGAWLLVIHVNAQPDTVKTPKVQYYNQFLAGGLIGKDAKIITLSSVMLHGVRYKRTSVAIGVAYDTYQEWKTTPFMLSLDYDLSVKPNTFFLQLEGGFGKVWHLDSEEDLLHYDEKNGRVLHPSIGYKIDAGRYSIYIMAGYKLQRIFYDETPKWWTEAYTNHVTRNMDRVTLRLGFGLR